MLINDRRKPRRTVMRPQADKAVAMSASVLLLITIERRKLHARPALDCYSQEKFGEAYTEFLKTFQTHPQTGAADKIQFDSGAAAYKMKDYKKAIESCIRAALFSKDPDLQSSSHYNLGNTLYQRGEGERAMTRS